MQVVSFALSPSRQATQLVSFSNIFAFCYCHKMQLGNADCGTWSFAFLAAGKKQMAIHNGYLLHLVIPSAFRAARYFLHLVIPFAFSAARKMQMVSFTFYRFRQEPQLASFSNIFAFCYCHKMQLGTLDYGIGSFAFLAAGKSICRCIKTTFCMRAFYLQFEPPTFYTHGIILSNQWHICILLLSQNAAGKCGLWDTVIYISSCWQKADGNS